jgi:hypothetical protein
MKPQSQSQISGVIVAPSAIVKLWEDYIDDS